MSTRTYNFRSRTDNGGIPPSRVPTTVVPRPPALADGTRDPPPHIPSSARNTGSPPLLYSEVVRSRTPSPRRETEVPVGQGLVSNPTGSGDTVEISPVPNVVDTTTYYSHCSPLRKAKPTWILHFLKGKTDGGRPNKNIPFS